ncbi:unnamed protein product [Calypogeia fissa]
MVSSLQTVTAWRCPVECMPGCPPAVQDAPPYCTSYWVFKIHWAPGVGLAGLRLYFLHDRFHRGRDIPGSKKERPLRGLAAGIIITLTDYRECRYRGTEERLHEVGDLETCDVALGPH